MSDYLNFLSGHSELTEWMITFFGNAALLAIWSLTTLVLTIAMTLVRSTRQERRLKRWARASAINVAISILVIVVINILSEGYLLEYVEGMARSRRAIFVMSYASLFTLILIPLQCLLLVLLSRRTAKSRERRRQRHHYS
ncbi:hypothetical protein C7446_2123 [Kushneria sinocarnis]|uniref:Uncharacterized protein n=1 Tax=Kushneria sinocarnis TaxID=595502 RepID=A0A420WV27_9GAMM|nr:hypothetical protein [Kushneria sinocarnis]RKR02409.1 hypothetical protein C7446_2123 [Kushneria sinocarnis]